MKKRMSEKTIQIEETNRKSLEDLITIIIHSEYEKIDMINFINEEFGLPKKEFSFVGITFNNKIAELSRILQKANLSIYPEYSEISNETCPSIVGSAIIYDIHQKCKEADLKLDEYIEFFDEIIDSSFQDKEGLKENIKRSFAYIFDCIFNDLDEQIILIDKDKQKKLNDIFNQYLAYIKIIEDYNLEDNLAESITNYFNILLTNNDIKDVLFLFEFAVIPTLEKLGLKRIIPEIIEKLCFEHLKSEIQNNIDKENTDIKFNL